MIKKLKQLRENFNENPLQLIKAIGQNHLIIRFSMLLGNAFFVLFLKYD